MTTTVDALVDRYLTDLEAELRGLPADRRREILDEVGEHITAAQPLAGGHRARRAGDPVPGVGGRYGAAVAVAHLDHPREGHRYCARTWRRGAGPGRPLQPGRLATATARHGHDGPHRRLPGDQVACPRQRGTRHRLTFARPPVIRYQGHSKSKGSETPPLGPEDPQVTGLSSGSWVMHPGDSGCGPEGHLALRTAQGRAARCTGRATA
jgi:hypothetical protein